MQTLNLKQLEVFCAVVERGGFTAAAEALYLAQSTVSGHISALEAEVGMPLLRRTGKRRIELTEAGERFYAHARTILHSCAELARELDEENSRELSVAASSIPAQYILPGLLTAFRRKEPEYRFHLRTGSSETVHTAVTRGDVNVGFVGAVMESGKLLYECIGEDPLVLVTPDTPEFREMLEQGCMGNELFSRPLIFREGGSGTQMAGQKYLTENGIHVEELNIVARMDNSEALLRAVENGMGCAVVSGLAARSSEKLLAFPLAGQNASRRLYMIRPMDRRPTRAAQKFIDFVLSQRKFDIGNSDI